MGTYLNPGNRGFAEMIQSGYVDKTGLIRLINRTIGTKKKLTCISRPRRFGKSYTAQMLCAYYDQSCDSSMLFADLEIARDPDYDAHKNQYNVIYLDMTNIMGDNREDGKQKPFISFIIRQVTEELLKAYPEMELKWDKTDTAAIAQIKERSYPQFYRILAGRSCWSGSIMMQRQKYTNAGLSSWNRSKEGYCSSGNCSFCFGDPFLNVVRFEKAVPKTVILL